MVELYNYQKKYLEGLKPRVIMAADTGTGKTYMALDHYTRYGQDQKLLILAPAAKIHAGDWEREIEKYFGQGIEDWLEYEIYSYEKFSRNPTLRQFQQGKRAIWKRFVPQQGGEQWAVIADECHRLKNPQSGIGKAVFQVVRGASFFVGLSATSMPNGWIDFANYSKIFGFTNGITQFKSRYCNIVDYKGFPEIKGYYHEDELKKQWNSISRPLPKSEANDLPARTFVGVNFKRPAKYSQTILQRKNDEGEILDTAGKLAHAIRQTLTPVKLDYLSELVDDTNENIVIFYNYISERDAILGMLFKKHKNKTVFRQDGERKELPTKSQWPYINNSVTVAQYRSGSTGIEMTYATIVVYLSPTYSYADYIQSIGRVYREGQKKKTTFYNFRTPGTIEQDIYDVLRSKSDFQVKQWYKKLTLMGE